MTNTEGNARNAHRTLTGSAEIVRAFLDTSGNTYRLLIVLVGITVAMALASPDKFLTVRNVTSMCFQFPELGIFALAITVTLITGGIDLSVVSTANFAGILAALVLTQVIPDGAPVPWILLGTAMAICAAIAAGMGCGIVNGWLVAHAGITPILATLGTMQLFAGLCYVITRGAAVHGYPEWFLFIGNGTIGPVPVPLIVFAAAAIGTAILLNRTDLGASLSLLGTNQTATKFSGIDIKRVLRRTYMISGLLAGTAAIVMIARTNSAKADYGSSYLLLAVLVAVLGGVDPRGGFGTVSGVVLSVLSLQFLSSGFSMLRFSNFTKEFAWGALLLLVMVANHVCQRLAIRIKDKQREIVTSGEQPP